MFIITIRYLVMWRCVCERGVVVRQGHSDIDGNTTTNETEIVYLYCLFES